jgi:hypothetical protein
MVDEDADTRNLIQGTSIPSVDTWSDCRDIPEGDKRGLAPTTAVTDPNGFEGAVKVVTSLAGGNDNQRIYETIPVTSEDKIISAYAKAAELKYLKLRSQLSSGVVFDLETGTAVTVSSALDYGIEDAGNGWYRVWIKVNDSSGNVQIVLCQESVGAQTYEGDGVSGFYLWEVQVETGASEPTAQQNVDDSLVVAETVYHQKKETYDDSVYNDMFSYYFGQYFFTKEAVFTDLPQFADAKIYVDIDQAGGTAEIGQVVFGTLKEYGFSQINGTGFKGLDFSFVQNDEFGNLSTVVREATLLHEYSVVVGNETLNWIAQDLKDLRGGKKAVWIGDADTKKATINYGFYRGFRNSFTTKDKSVLTIEVQGVV